MSLDLDNLQCIAASAAITHKFPPEHLMSLIDKYQDPAEIEAVFRLFASNQLTTFQASLLNQVIMWCREPSPKYATPLSAKQIAALTRQRPTIDRNWKKPVSKDTRSFQYGLKHPAPAPPAETGIKLVQSADEGNDLDDMILIFDKLLSSKEKQR